MTSEQEKTIRNAVEHELGELQASGQCNSVVHDLKIVLDELDETRKTSTVIRNMTITKLDELIIYAQRRGIINLSERDDLLKIYEQLKYDAEDPWPLAG